MLHVDVLAVDLAYACEDAGAHVGDAVVVSVARGIDLTFLHGGDELVECVSECGLESSVDDGEEVGVCGLAVDVDASEYGDDVFCVDGVFDLCAVDHECLFHDFSWKKFVVVEKVRIFAVDLSLTGLDPDSGRLGFIPNLPV